MSNILLHTAPIGEARDRELLKDATTFAYRQTAQGTIHAHFFQQEEANEGMLRPAFVFFHGGFWDSPMSTQFVPHCLHFSSRGAVGIAAETRVSAKHGTGPLEAIDDARFLVAELKRKASGFGIDPEKIVVGGAAGGAFLALHTVMPKKIATEDVPHPYPAAVILFSSLLDTTPNGIASERFPDPKSAKINSPSKLMRRKLPPMILFHGRADRITPFEDAASFRRSMRWHGNKCELVDYERAEHSFFNFNVSSAHFDMTIAAADRFMVECGILPPLEE